MPSWQESQMTFSNQHGWLLLILVTASTNQAFGQDIFWSQPYSGNVAYGPLSPPDGGALPKCPKCECETCQPSGPKGFLKRLFGGSCEKVRSARHEWYYAKQIYHTGYTAPILPPYCEFGHGYYETSWRQPPVCAVPCDPAFGSHNHSHNSEVAPVHVMPFPAPHPQPPEAKPQDLKLQNKANEASQIPSAPAGDEKPRYEEPAPKSGYSLWKKTTPVSGQYYR
jgi:hypothetical protein